MWSYFLELLTIRAAKFCTANGRITHAKQDEEQISDKE